MPKFINNTASTFSGNFTSNEIPKSNTNERGRIQNTIQPSNSIINLKKNKYLIYEMCILLNIWI